MYDLSEKGDLEKTKQILAFVVQENITEEEMGGMTHVFKSTYAPKLLDQMLHYNQTQNVKLPAFLISEVPSFLDKMSGEGDLEKVKQIFEYVNRENIRVEEMGVKNNEVNQGKKPTLVDHSCYNGSNPLILAALYGHHQICQ